MYRFTIIYYRVDPQIIKHIQEFLCNAFNVEIKVGAIDKLPKDFFDVDRGQYRADLLNRWLYKTFGDEDTVIGLLNVDAYVPPLNFVFGVATPNNDVCTVYLYRLNINVSVEGFIQRIRKEVLHELGHLFGLRHCTNNRCVMSFSNSLLDVDFKTEKFCRKHFIRLINGGLKIKNEFLLE